MNYSMGIDIDQPQQPQVATAIELKGRFHQWTTLVSPEFDPQTGQYITWSSLVLRGCGKVDSGSSQTTANQIFSAAFNGMLRPSCHRPIRNSRCNRWLHKYDQCFNRSVQIIPTSFVGSICLWLNEAFKYIDSVSIQIEDCTRQRKQSTPSASQEN